MAKRVYSDDEKAAALVLLADASKSFYEVRDETQIPIGTLHRWATAAGLKRSDATTREAIDRRRLRLQEKREALAEQFLDRVADLEDRMDEEHIDFRGKEAAQVTFPKATSGDVRNYAVAMGVLWDKFRLEMGEATTRAEHIASPVDRLKERVDELSQRRAKRSA